MAGREKKDADPTVEWTHLTAKECAERRQRVLQWLDCPNPNRKLARQIVSDLQDLAVDVLVRDAFDRFHQHQEETGAPQERRGEKWEKHRDQAGQAAADSAQRFRDELLSLVCQDREAVRAALLKTMKWWLKKRRMGSAENLDSLLERLADTLAGVLVFKNLSRIKGRQEAHLWDVLLRQVVERLILPRLGLARVEVSEDFIRECMVAILAAAFTWQGLGPAIQFFTQACRLRRKQQPQQVETEPWPEEAPEEEGARHSPPPCARGPWTVPSAQDEALAHLPDKKAPVPAPAGSGAQGSEPQAQEPSFWEQMQQTFGQDAAIQFWILGLLKEDRRQEWKEIANLVLQNCCGLLSNDDLPPGVTWQKVHQAFQNMANRSRKTRNTLTADALRQFYARAKRALQSLKPAG